MNSSGDIRWANQSLQGSVCGELSGTDSRGAVEIIALGTGLMMPHRSEVEMESWRGGVIDHDVELLRVQIRTLKPVVEIEAVLHRRVPVGSKSRR
jgi:hypothetical protein